MFLDIHVTERCNLRCKHCYLNSEFFEEGREMSFEMFTNLVDDLFSMNHRDDFRDVYLSGGECTTHPRIADMMKYIHYKYDSKVGIVTNGYKIPELLEQNAFRRDEAISISVDGNREVHNWVRGEGSFEKVERALRALQKHKKVGYNLHLTVHQKNIDQVREVCEFGKMHGVGTVGINFFQPVRGEEHPFDSVTVEQFREAQDIAAEYFGDKVKKEPCYLNGCHAGIGGLAVLPDGTYWDCARNQKELGQYPEKLETAIYRNLLDLYGRQDSRNTCMKHYYNKERV
jgi:MoaA/NifB/PqqE/SkfB family radical SAM enzyme